jgi:hypothetical protein
MLLIGAVALTIPATWSPPSGAVGHTVDRAYTSIGDALDRIPVVPQIDNGYTYDTFAVPRVNRTDSRGCQKRERVLIASAASKPRVTAGCRLSGGSWLIDNGAKTVKGSSKIDVVPLVSSKTAWNQGAFGWSGEQRRSFLKWYQQPARECAIGSITKSDSGCAYVLQSKAGLTAQITDLTTEPGWKPTCEQVVGVTSILLSWGLSVEPSAAAKMQAKAAQCSGSVQVASLNTANPLPPTTSGNPFLTPEAAARVWAPSRVLDAPAGPVVPAELFGLHVPEMNGQAPQATYAWLRLWDAKTGWEPLEQNKGHFYWKSLDDAVAFAEAGGKKVLYVFGDTPGWAGPSPAYPPSDINEYRKYVQAVVSRYGNRIHAYEVWNEPNLFVKVSDSLADLVDMTQILHDTIKAAGQSSLVLTPSTTMRTGTAVYSFFSKYLVKLAERGWPVDGYAFHTYPRAAGGPQERVQAIAQFKAILALAKAPAKPIWDTEINYGLGGLQEPRRAVDGSEAQGYLAQTFIDAVRLGITQVDWYLWFPRDYGLLGVQLNPGTTDTIRAWKWTHDLLVGSSLRSCGNAGGAVVCGFARDGKSFALAYSSSGAPVQVSVPSTLTTQCDMDGRCTPVAGGVVTVGIRPVQLT